MNKEKLQDLSQRLNEEKARLEALADRTAKHLYRREEPYSADFAEQAVEVQNNEVVEQIDHDAQVKLRLINKALERIAEGEYGLCTSCGEAINEERLEAIPHAEQCIDCAS